MTAENEKAVAQLHDDGCSCRCPVCGKLNMDLDIAGNPADQEFMCIRCGADFLIAAGRDAKGLA